MTDYWVDVDRAGWPLVRWRFEPLAEKVAASGQNNKHLAALCGVQDRTLYRWRLRGLTDAEADRLAVGMGWHPFEVWPEWLDYDSEEAA